MVPSSEHVAEIVGRQGEFQLFFLHSLLCMIIGFNMSKSVSVRLSGGKQQLIYEILSNLTRERVQTACRSQCRACESTIARLAMIQHLPQCERQMSPRKRSEEKSNKKLNFVKRKLCLSSFHLINIKPSSMLLACWLPLFSLSLSEVFLLCIFPFLLAAIQFSSIFYAQLHIPNLHNCRIFCVFFLLLSSGSIRCVPLWLYTRSHSPLARIRCVFLRRIEKGSNLQLVFSRQARCFCFLLFLVSSFLDEILSRFSGNRVLWLEDSSMIW